MNHKLKKLNKDLKASGFTFKERREIIRYFKKEYGYYESTTFKNKLY